MSKKQVILLSLLAAVPALALLTALVFAGLEHGTEFSGMVWAIVAVTGILTFVAGASPVALLAWYPAEGFGTAVPVPPPGTTSPGPAPVAADDEFEDDEAEFADDDAGGEELFDDGFDDDEYDDDLGGFDDDDDEEWA